MTYAFEDDFHFELKWQTFIRIRPHEGLAIWWYLTFNVLTGRADKRAIDVAMVSEFDDLNTSIH